MRAFHTHSYIKFFHNGTEIEGLINDQDSDSLIVNGIRYRKDECSQGKLRYYLLKVDRGSTQQTINSTFRTHDTTMIDAMLLNAYKKDPNRKLYISEMYL